MSTQGTMDSIRHFSKKLGLDRLFTFQSSHTHAAFCCISLVANGFYLLKTRPSLHKKLMVDFFEFVPCALKDFPEMLATKVKAQQLQTASCAWILSPDKYQFLQTEALPVTAQEFQAAIRWKMKDMISYPIDDAVIDSFPIPPANTPQAKKNIAVIAAQKSYLLPLSETLQKCGMDLATIGIPELAMAEVASLYEQEKNSIALVHLQERQSRIIVTREKEFYFSRRLDWGLALLKSAGDNIEQIQPVIDKLILEIQRSFDYFQSQWRLPAPNKIILAPEDKPSLPISDYLRQRLTMDVIDLDLNYFVETPIPLSITQQGQFLPLIGAALINEINTHATAD